MEEDKALDGRHTIEEAMSEYLIESQFIHSLLLLQLGHL
jgi:hypothetical protein